MTCMYSVYIYIIIRSLIILTALSIYMQWCSVLVYLECVEFFLDFLHERSSYYTNNCKLQYTCQADINNICIHEAINTPELYMYTTYYLSSVSYTSLCSINFLVYSF